MSERNNRLSDCIGLEKNNFKALDKKKYIQKTLNIFFFAYNR